MSWRKQYTKVSYEQRSMLSLGVEKMTTVFCFELLENGLFSQGSVSPLSLSAAFWVLGKQAHHVSLAILLNNLCLRNVPIDRTVRIFLRALGGKGMWGFRVCPFSLTSGTLLYILVTVFYSFRLFVEKLRKGPEYDNILSQRQKSKR